MRHISLLLSPRLRSRPHARVRPAETVHARRHLQRADPARRLLRGQVDGQILSSDNLIGAKIHGTDGKIIADIEELILSSDMRVEGVIIGTGGFLGTGEKRIGLRFSALRFGPRARSPYPN